MLEKYFIQNLYFLMSLIEIRETQRAYVLEVRVHQYNKKARTSTLQEVHNYITTMSATKPEGLVELWSGNGVTLV